MSKTIVHKISQQQTESTKLQTKSNRHWISIVATVVMIILMIGALASSIYFYSLYSNIVKNPETIASESTRSLVSTLAQIIQLPNDEEPTIATVNDKTKLTDQPFFVKSENGDKVFIYAKNKKAILFRPSNSKVIEVANISIDALNNQDLN
jgi:cytoskeletal protein RodZ